jgi:hypothetical protein
MAEITNQAQNVSSTATSSVGAATSAISNGVEQINKIKAQIEQIKKLKNSIPKNLFNGANKNAKKILLKVYKLLKKIVIEILKNLPICELIGQIPLDEIKQVAKYAIKLRNETISLLTKILNIVTSILSITSILEILLNVFNTIVNLIPIITAAIPSAVAGVGIPVGVGVNFSALLAKMKSLTDDISEILGLINDSIRFIATKLGELINTVVTVTQSMFACLEKIAFLEAAQENPRVYTHIAGTDIVIDNLIQNKFNDLIGEISPIPNIDLGIKEESYKGFTFDIKVKKTLKGVQQNYAVALDMRKIIVLEGKPSFASDSNVLINELKLIIDQQNLSGF